MTVTPPGPDLFPLTHHYARTFPLLNETTPTFLGVPPAHTPADLAGAGAAIIGIPYVIPEFPFVREQGYGAVLGLTVFYVWTARRYLLEAIRAASGLHELQT